MTPLTWSLLRCELVTICAGFSLDLICLWPGRIRPASLTRKSILTIAPESVESHRYRTHGIVHETTTVRSQLPMPLADSRQHSVASGTRNARGNHRPHGSTFSIFHTFSYAVEIHLEIKILNKNLITKEELIIKNPIYKYIL